MRALRHILVAGLLLLFSPLEGLDKHREEIYGAFLDNDMPRWKEIVDEMSLLEHPSTGQQEALLNYHYGYIAWCVGNKRKKEARVYLDRAGKVLHVLEKQGADASLLHAYKAAFYGFEVRLSPVKAPLAGPKNVNHARLSIQQDPANAFGIMQYAYANYFAPELLWGSREEAIRLFLEAREILESSPGEIKNDWNYLFLLTSIASAYEEEGMYAEARAYYQLILGLEPGFSRVRDELYPAFLLRADSR